MSEGWRRATAGSPSKRYNGGKTRGQVDNSASLLGMDESQVLRQEVTRLHGTVHDLVSSRDSLSNELQMTKADSSAISEIARRDLIESTGRERRRADKAESHLNTISTDNHRLQQQLSETTLRARDVGDALSHTKSTYERELLNLKVAQADQVQSLKMENQSLVEENRRYRHEREAFERLINDLKMDLEAAERTIQDQQATVRSLTVEMSRRDPVKTVKHHREVTGSPSLTVGENRHRQQLQELSAKVEELNEALGQSQDEREAALNQMAALQEQISNTASVSKTTKMAQQTKAEADQAKSRAEVNMLKAEVEALNSELTQVTADYNDLLTMTDDEKVKSQDRSLAAEDQVSKLQAQMKENANKNKASMAKEREQYEARIIALQQELKHTQEELENQEELFEDQKAESRKRANDAKKKNELSSQDMSRQLKAMQSKLATQEKYVQQKEREMAELATAKQVSGTQMTSSSTKAGPKGDDIVVSFTVQSCANLLQRDGMLSGDSDPFVIVRGIDPEAEPLLRTPTVDNNCNPTWAADEAKVKVSINTASPGFLKFEVWDLNPMKNDFLGVFRLAVGDIFATGSGVRTFALTGREKETDSKIISNSRALGTITLNLDIPGVAPSKQPKLENRALPKNSVTEEVTFYVSGCQDLLDRDGGGFVSGTSDPFIIVLDPSGKEVLRSETIDNSLNPHWPVDNTSVKLNLVKSSSGFVTFQVWNWNVTSHDFLGGCRLSVADVFNQGSGQKKMKLGPRLKETDPDILSSPNKLGTLTLNVTVMDDAQAADGKNAERSAPLQVKNVPYDVTFFVNGCQDLWDRDGGGFVSGKSDPFVKINDPSGNTVHRCETVDDTLNPTWPIDKGSCKMTLLPKAEGFVSFEVWNWNATTNDFLGCYRFPVKKVFETGTGEHTFKLVPRPKENDPKVTEQNGKLGTITITTNVMIAPPVAKSSENGETSQEARAAINKNKYDVSFYIASCSNLLERDGGGFSGLSDPFVKVLNLDKEPVLTTETMDNTLDPKWGPETGTVKLKLSPGGTKFVEFQVWNWNATKNDFLGSVRMSEKDVFAKSSGPRLLPLLPREKENDPEITKNTGKLGKIKIFVTIPDGIAPEAPAPTTKPADPVVAGEPTPAAVAPTPKPPAANSPEKKSTAVTPAPSDATNVTVHIVSCDGLLNRDGWPAGESDPLVRVYNENGDEVLVTETIEDTLDPKWPEKKESVKMGVTAKGATYGKKKLRFEVWNHNTVGSNDFLGCALLTGDEVLAKGTGRHTFPLTPRMKENDETVVENKGKLGNITVEFRLPGAPASPAKPVRPKNAAVAEPAPTADLNAPRTVTVSVCDCSNILNRDSWPAGVSDPFVKVCDETGEVVHTTETVEDTLEPKFVEKKETLKLVATPKGNTDVSTKKKIRFEVWNHNTVGSHDFLGCVNLSGEDLINRGSGRHSFKLTPRPKENDETVQENEGKLGTMTLSFKIPEPPMSGASAAPSPKKPTKAAPPQRQPVVVADPDDDDDLPVVETRKKAKATPVRRAEPDPVIEETPPPPPPPPPPVEPPQPVVQPKVATPVKPKPEPVVEQTPPPIQRSPPPSNKTTEEGDFTGGQSASYNSRTAPKGARTVKIHVKGLHDVIDRDGGGFIAGVSDPTVRIKDPAGKEILKTEPVKNNLSPTWTAIKGSVRTKVEPTTEGCFSFVVENDNVMQKNDFLGQVKLDVKSEILAKAIGLHDFSLPLQPRENEADPIIKNKVGKLGTIDITLTII